jgi:hypothetical protein
MDMMADNSTFEHEAALPQSVAAWQSGLGHWLN